MLLAIVASTTFSLADQKRIALVVGNSGYTNLSPLKNSVNDARAIASSLRAVGFEVAVLEDADQRSMKRALLDFSRNIRSDVEATFVFYAGHGVQVDGENYLMPVDANVSSEDEVALEGINANDFLQVLKGSSGQVNIVVLDACRNNPFPASFRSATRGLAAVLAPRGTFIGYSTAPGSVAFDGDGKNSAYTAALAAAILEPGLEIAQVFRRVRQTVLAATKDEQVPWESSSIIGEFYFKPSTSDGADPQMDPQAYDLEAAAEWMKLRNSSDPSALKRFAQKYSGNPFADLALARLSTLIESALEPVAEPNANAVPLINDAVKFAGIPNAEIPNDLRMQSSNELAEAERAAKGIDTVRGWQLYLARYGASDAAYSAGLKGLQNTIERANKAKVGGGRVEAASVEEQLLPSLTQRRGLQTTLSARGFGIGTVDGVFGNRTRSAIKALQTSEGLEPTGFLDANLLSQLGVSWYKPPTDNFTSGDTAQWFVASDLRLLGEDPRIVNLVECLSPRNLVYGAFEGKVYAAVFGSIGYTIAETNKKLADCGLRLVTIRSKAENNFVYGLVEHDQRFWTYGRDGKVAWKRGPMIGLVQAPGSREPAGGWHWASGVNSSYRNWRPGEPGNYGGREQFAAFFHIDSQTESIQQRRADRWSDVFDFSGRYIVESY